MLKRASILLILISLQ